MEFLLSSSFDVQGKEGKNLIERIQTSYNTENKDDFLKIGEEIADMIVEKNISTGLSGEGQTFNENMYKIIQNLGEMQSMAFVQSLVRIRRDNKAVMNDVMGDSDDIFKHLKEISKRIDEEQIEEGVRIKKGTAFYF